MTKMNFQNIELTVQMVKGNAEAYFSNRDIPLAERWSAFTKAPSYIKNDLGSMCSELDEYFGKDVVMYEGIVSVKRRSRHDTVNILENLEEGYRMGEVDHLPLDTIKEKILAKNFGFFTYDW